MPEILIVMALLFAAYVFMPSTWFAKFAIKPAAALIAVAPSTASPALIPEDSTLKRHFITQLRSEIEQEMAPRPTDSTLQRHYEAQVAAKLAGRLSA